MNPQRDYLLGLLVLGITPFASTCLLTEVRAASPLFLQEPTNKADDTTVQPSTNRVEDDLATLQHLVSSDAGETVNRELTKLGRKHLPEVHLDTKKWGKQKEFSSLLPRSEPLVLNHGTWRKYEVRPIDPDETFRVRLKDMRSEGGKVCFTLECDAKIALEGRQAKWVRGVQLYSVNAEGKAELTLALECKVGVGFDFSGAPAMVLSPEIESATITIHEFRIDRVSKVGGEFAQQLTRATRDWLDDRQERHEEKLVNKLNQQIEKKKDRLRIPLGGASRVSGKTVTTKPLTAEATENHSSTSSRQSTQQQR